MTENEDKMKAARKLVRGTKPPRCHCPTCTGEAEAEREEAGEAHVPTVAELDTMHVRMGSGVGFAAQNSSGPRGR